MKKKLVSMVLAAAMISSVFTGCGNSDAAGSAASSAATTTTDAAGAATSATATSAAATTSDAATETPATTASSTVSSSTDETASVSAAPITGTVTAAGSSALLPLAQAAAESFMEENPDCVVTVNGGGSGEGLKQVADGAIDIGNSDVFA